MIPFNKPFLTGKEINYIQEAVKIGKISGNGFFTKKCQSFFEDHYGFKKALMTTSCTDALEMAAILSDIKAGDEVIAPSYTFVSTVLAFIRQGAKIIFCDSYENNPNIDANKIESLITPKTKVIIPVHYSGVACDMDKIMNIAKKHNIIVVEDAAQAIDSFYKGRPLGSIGQFGCFSFHETKNIIAGEGGLLTVNDEIYIRRSEIIWEKGTNRAEFYRGEVNKYGWVDTGSSFLPSELNSGFLWAQLENIDIIQTRRKEIWYKYYEGLSYLAQRGLIQLPQIPEYATNNAHIFYIICQNLNQRTKLIEFLKSNNILSVFHYLSLHKSKYYLEICNEENVSIPELPNADHFTDCLLRLPLYFELSFEEVDFIIESIKKFYS